MKVIIISGPTACGKTGLSIELARNFGGEIINFDSLLLYKEINIGTAKPNLEERDQVPHHMIDIASISRPLNAADYAKLALPIINELHANNKFVYLVGGSGFYLQALLQGMYESKTTSKEILEKSELLYQEEGIQAFRKILEESDFRSFKRYHENDHYRIRRAVEHFWSTGIPFSNQREKKDLENTSRNHSNIHGWRTLHLYVDLPKDEHLNIIKKRTEKMLNQGLVEEVKSLLNQGFSGLEKPLQSIGYKEVVGLHLGMMKDEAECLNRIIISTRQLAKSQRTWFNRIQDKKSYHPEKNRQEIFSTVKKFIGIDS